MKLRSGGIDAFYIDESHDQRHYLVTSVRVPFLRNVDGTWNITWKAHFDGAKAWRKRLKTKLNIPVNKELHGNKLAAARGNFFKGKHNFSKPKAGAVYRECLSEIDFLPQHSIMSAVAPRGKFLFGRDRLNAAMMVLFQRIRRQCYADDRNGIIFFDSGHPEYRHLYRASCLHLMTGRKDGDPVNLPLDMFVKDGNYKDSKHCFFTQTADMIAYAAFLKIKGENGNLTPTQQTYSHNNFYGALQGQLVNPLVSPQRDGIVRL